MGRDASALASFVDIAAPILHLRLRPRFIWKKDSVVETPISMHQKGHAAVPNYKKLA